MISIMKKLLSLTLFVSLLITFQFSVLAADGKININTANQQELTMLKRIGSKYAARIIEYREKNGEFKNPQDIVRVSGIGWKTFEANKDMIITMEEETETVAKTD